MATPSKKTSDANQNNTTQIVNEYSQPKQYGRQVEALDSTPDPDINSSFEQALARFLSQNSTDFSAIESSLRSSIRNQVQQRLEEAFSQVPNQSLEEVDQLDLNLNRRIQTHSMLQQSGQMAATFPLHNRYAIQTWNKNPRIETVFNRSVRGLDSEFAPYGGLSIMYPANEHRLIGGGPQGPANQEEVVKKWTESGAAIPSSYEEKV